MKKLNYTFMTIMIMMIFMTQNIFAMPMNPIDYTSVNEVSELLPQDIKKNRVVERAKARGDFFISADLTILDNGGGNIGAFAIALTRYPVDEAYITVYLDKWDAANQKWHQVNSYEAEYLATDYPDGLTTPKVDVTFTNNEKGCYYRLRSVFAVMYQGKLEGFSPTTDGILVD